MATVRFIDIKLRSKKAERNVKNLDKKMKGLGKTTDTVEKSMFSLSKVAGAVSAALVAQKVVAYADAWSNVQSQLKLATSSTEELTKVTTDLLEISNQTRSSFEATANLYARLERSTRDLGVTQEDLLGITKSITQAFIISGASSAEASAGITQLSQALASGVLRGDEFNSVAESAPRLMQAFADATGKTRGELRELAAQGAITADVVVQALKDQGEAIEKDFGQTIPTVAQGITQLSDAILLAVGRLNEVTGAGNAFSSFLGELANDITVLITGEANIKSLTDDIVDLTESLQLAQVRGAPETVIQGLINDIKTAKEELFSLESSVSKTDILKGVFGGDKKSGAAVVIPDKPETAAQAERRQRRLDAQQKQFEDSVAFFERETQLSERHLRNILDLENGIASEAQINEENRFLDKVAKLQDRNAIELEALGANEAAKVELRKSFDHAQAAALTEHELLMSGIRISAEEDSAQQIIAIKATVNQQAIGLARLLVGNSKKAAIALIAVEKGLGIAQTLVNSQVGATKALAVLGPIAGPPAAASILTFGKISAGLIAATGLAQAASIGGSSPSIGGGGGGQQAPTATAQDLPQQTRAIDIRIDDNALLTGAMFKEALNSVLESDSDIAINISNAQAEAVRTGAT
jgi:tape measure domain-containing protein